MITKTNTYLYLHLLELKYNLIISLIIFFYFFILSYYFSDQLIYLFIKILLKSKMLKYFIFTDITEMFLTNFLISFLLSFFISIHFWFLQIWYFFSKGLYKYENLKCMQFIIVFLIFNLILIYLIFIQIIPNIWYFFIKITFINNYIFNIYFEPKLNDYFYFIFTSFIYIYILCFYFFIFLFYLNKIFKIKNIIVFRKFFYMKFLMMATIISPPDIISQLTIAFLFCIIFEILIFVSFFCSKYYK